MQFKSNCLYKQEPEEGSIFWLKDNKLGITIHNYSGCGKRWFLTCNNLNIKQHSLDTEDFTEAVLKAKGIIGNMLSEYMSELLKISNENEPIELVRY